MDKLPAYRTKLLADQPAAPVAEDLFFHLGYWPEPEQAKTGLDELKRAQARLNDQLLDLAQMRDGLDLLDVGCGVGGTIAALQQGWADLRLCGLNIDAEQLRAAQRNLSAIGQNRPSWVRADGCHLPFADHSFDRITAVECIFHFASRQRFIAEAARLLRPGGLLVFSDFVTSAELRAKCDCQAPTWKAIRQTICDAVGPWPDFWGLEQVENNPGATAGLSLAARRDVSPEVHPSYRCFLSSPPIGHPAEATHADPIDRAMALLEWLQEQRLVGMELFALSR